MRVRFQRQVADCRRKREALHEFARLPLSDDEGHHNHRRSIRRFSVGHVIAGIREKLALSERDRPGQIAGTAQVFRGTGQGPGPDERAVVERQGPKACRGVP